MMLSSQMFLLVCFKIVHICGRSKQKAKGEERKALICLRRKERRILKAERTCLRPRRQSVAQPGIEARCSVTICLNKNLTERCFSAKPVFLSLLNYFFCCCCNFFFKGYLKNGMGSVKWKWYTEESKIWDICLHLDLPWAKKSCSNPNA